MDAAEKKPRGKRGQGCVYEVAGSRNLWVKFSVAGKVYRMSANTEKTREAENFLKNEILKHANGDAVDNGRVTVDDLYSVLLADYRINGKCESWCELNWRVHLKPIFGGTLAKNVGTESLNRYIESRRAEKAANGSINRELSLLQRAFMLGYESQPRKVARPLRFHRLAESKPRNGFIEQKTYDALAAHCTETYMRAMLALAYSFGFRKGELLSLKVSDVDLMEGTLRLRDSKNGEARQISLTAETRSLLAECVRGKFSNDALFTRKCGNAVQDFRGTWEVITTAAGCPGLLFHDLRRSAVRNLIRCGVSEHVAMKISGHKTASVFRRYDIVDARDLADAARKIESGAVSHSSVIVEESGEKTESEKPVRIQ